jgi:hypothetical protein
MESTLISAYTALLQMIYTILNFYSDRNNCPTKIILLLM